MQNSDFKYFKNKLLADKEYHNKEFIQRIDPDLIDAYFEGDPDFAYAENLGKRESYVSRLSINKLFPSSATLLSELYPSNPKFICSAKRSENELTDELNAKIATSALNYYYDEMYSYKENCKAIMSAWLYGYGVIKQGWRTVTVNPKKEIQSKPTLLNRFMNVFNPKAVNVEEDKTSEYIAEDAPFINFVNSKDLYFDKDKSFGKGKFIHQHMKKSIQELKDSNIYNIDEDFINRYSRGKDAREVFVDIYESWIFDNRKMSVFVYCEGYDKELRFEEMPYVSEGFPFKILTFTEQVNRIYPISHMKVAQRQQKMNDYLLTLQKDTIEKFKDITVWDGDAFDPDDKNKIRLNKIGTNVFTKNGRPPSGTAQHIGGNSIPNDMLNLQAVLDNNIKEILTVTGARVSGQSEFDTAAQEKISDAGNQIRSMGMEDKINKFLVEQGKKLLQDIKQFATEPMILKITGLNIVDDFGNKVTDKWIEFSTDKSPQALREIIPQDLDINVDVAEVAKRNLPLLRRQLDEFVKGTVLPLMPMLQASGKMFDAEAYIKDAAKNYETLTSPEKYIVDIPPPPMPMGLPQGQGMAPEAPLSPPMAQEIPQGLPPEQGVPIGI